LLNVDVKRGSVGAAREREGSLVRQQGKIKKKSLGGGGVVLLKKTRRPGLKKKTKIKNRSISTGKRRACERHWDGESFLLVKEGKDLCFGKCFVNTKALRGWRRVQDLGGSKQRKGAIKYSKTETNAARFDG